MTIVFNLTWLLGMKIFFTAIWIITCLSRQLQSRLGPPVEPALMGHLLGAAFFALLVGYLQAAMLVVVGHAGILNEVVFAIVGVGAVSNGLAAIALIYFRLQEDWDNWTPLGHLFAYISIGALVYITTGLVWNLYAL